MKVGIAILSMMAAIWAAWSLYAGHGPSWTYVGAVGIALVPLVLMTTRRFPRGTKDDARRKGLVVGLASFVEIAAIIGGIQWVARAGRPDLIVCVIAAVVGCHFIPLARWLPMPKYYFTGPALMAAAGAGVALPAEYRVVVVAGVAAAILWLTALAMVFATPRPAPASD
jgi:hypothetical protein